MGDRKTDKPIDVCKIVCALLIIAIHVRPLVSYSKVLDFYVVDIIARLAVPFFYAATSYFFFGKLTFSENGTAVKCHENKMRLVNYLKRILILYSVWSVIYLFWQIPYWNSIGWTGISAFVDYMISFCMKGSVYHFWYFVSLIYGVIILYILLQKAGIKIACHLAVLLYLIKCLVYGYSWTNIPMINEVEKIWNVFSGLFDGICLALPFMMVGVLASQKKEIYPKILRYRKIGLVVSITGLVAEASLLFFCSANEGMYSYIIFTLPVCLFFFTNVLESKMDFKGKRFVFELRKYSTLLFCIHPFVIYLCELNETFNAFNSLAKYIVVVAISMLLVAVVVKIRKHSNLKILSYLM